jgi:hypothetical protein
MFFPFVHFQKNAKSINAAVVVGFFNNHVFGTCLPFAKGLGLTTTNKSQLFDRLGDAIL